MKTEILVRANTLHKEIILLNENLEYFSNNRPIMGYNRYYTDGNHSFKDFTNDYDTNDRILQSIRLIMAQRVATLEKELEKL